jgi:outer membrane beta-barrel protein
VTPLANGQFLNTVTNVSKSRFAGLELVASGRIVKGLTYNISSNLYWLEIAPQPLGAPEARSAFSASGRGNVTWQVTPKDMVQFNGFLNGQRLTSQGHIEPFGALNIGYRRKITDQLSFLLTVNDGLHTIRFRQVIDTPTLQARQNIDIDSRQFQAGFTWTFGGGRPKDQGFDFQNGGAPPQ